MKEGVNLPDTNICPPSTGCFQKITVSRSGELGSAKGAPPEQKVWSDILPTFQYCVMALSRFRIRKKAPVVLVNCWVTLTILSYPWLTWNKIGVASTTRRTKNSHFVRTHFVHAILLLEIFGTCSN